MRTLKRCIVIILICCLSISIAAAELKPDVHSVFDIRTNGAGVCVTKNGSFVLLGNDGVNASDTVAKALCIDPNGKVLWETLATFVNGSTNDFLTGIELPNGDILTSTMTVSRKNDTVSTNNSLIRLSEGDITETYEEIGSFSGLLLPMGECFIIQRQNDEPFSHTVLSLYDETFNLQWDLPFGFCISISKILPINNDYLIVGSASFCNEEGELSSTGYVSRITHSGEQIWEYFSTENQTLFADAIVNKNDSIIICGGYNTGKPMYSEEVSQVATLTKLNCDGALVWHREYPLENVQLNCLVDTGQEVLAAGLRHTEENNYIAMYMFDSMGKINKQWIENPELTRPLFIKLLSTSNGIYYVTSVRKVENQEYNNGCRYLTYIEQLNMQ